MPPAKVLGVVLETLVNTSDPGPDLIRPPPAASVTCAAIIRSTGDKPEVTMVLAAEPRARVPEMVGVVARLSLTETMVPVGVSIPPVTTCGVVVPPVLLNVSVPPIVLLPA